MKTARPFQFINITGRLALALLGLLTLPAHAAIITITTRAAFEAATTGLQTLDFEGVAGVNSYVHYGASQTFSGVTFGSPGNRLFVFDNGWYNANGPATDYLSNDGGPTGLTIAFPAGTTAFGADFSRINQGHPNQNFLATFSFAGGINLVRPVTAGSGSTFYGFISDQPLIGVTYSDGNPFGNGHSETMDNFTFGMAAVPEPSTAFTAVGLAMVCAGTLTRHWWRNRLSKDRAAN